jgi:hypothetical protein
MLVLSFSSGEQAPARTRRAAHARDGTIGLGGAIGEELGLGEEMRSGRGCKAVGVPCRNTPAARGGRPSEVPG